MVYEISYDLEMAEMGKWGEMGSGSINREMGEMGSGSINREMGSGSINQGIA